MEQDDGKGDCMRKRSKFLVTASIFAVAMNMNGCGAYGPPDEFDPWWNIAEPAYGVPYYYEEPTATIAPTESGWYKLTQRAFAVLRIVSVPQKVQEEEETPADAVYGIEMLNFYDGNGADLCKMTGISLRFKDRYLFSEGDVLLVELGANLQEGDEGIYQVQYEKDRPVHTWFEYDGEAYHLEILQGFKRQTLYDYLYDFNAYTEWNYKVNQREGSEDSLTEPVYFEDGMTIEEAAVFFDAITKAKEEYETAKENK